MLINAFFKPFTYEPLTHQAHLNGWSLFLLIVSVHVVIIVFTHVDHPPIRLHFSEQNLFQAKIMFATGETVVLAEWIIDNIGMSCLVYFLGFSLLYFLSDR